MRQHLGLGPFTNTKIKPNNRTAAPPTREPNNPYQQWAPATQYATPIHPHQTQQDQKLTKHPHQLDRFVGLAMLILASTVFAYYTVWTLLMVCPTPSMKRRQKSSLARNEERGTAETTANSRTTANTSQKALRRRLPLYPKPIPSPCLGHPHPRHSSAARRRGRWKLLERRHG